MYEKRKPKAFFDASTNTLVRVLKRVAGIRVQLNTAQQQRGNTALEAATASQPPAQHAHKLHTKPKKAKATSRCLRVGQLAQLLLVSAAQNGDDDEERQIQGVDHKDRARERVEPHGDVICRGARGVGAGGEARVLECSGTPGRGRAYCWLQAQRQRLAKDRQRPGNE